MRQRVIRPGDNLELDLGLDSMRRVELLVAVEQKLGGDVEESQLAGIYTVRELMMRSSQSAASGKLPHKQQFAGWSAVLREDPTDPAVLAICKHRFFTDRLIYLVSRLIKLAWRVRSRIDVEGLENLPRDGAYLLCSNHQSFLDPAILLAVLPLRSIQRMFAVGTSEIFGSGFMLRVARIMRTVVVDPDANLVPAMRAGAYGLRHGLALVLYPEGERSIDGTPQDFQEGRDDTLHSSSSADRSRRGRRHLRLLAARQTIPEIRSHQDQDWQADACRRWKAEASEEAYAKFTAELKARVVEMWEELRK